MNMCRLNTNIFFIVFYTHIIYIYINRTTIDCAIIVMCITVVIPYTHSVHTQQYAAICITLRCVKLWMLFHCVTKESSTMNIATSHDPYLDHVIYTYIYIYTSIRWDGHQSSIHRNLYMQQGWKNWILMASGPQQYPGHRLRWRGPCLGCRGAWGWVDPSNTYRMSWACSVSKWLLGS